MSAASCATADWTESGTVMSPMPLWPWMWGTEPAYVPACGSAAPTATGMVARPASWVSARVFRAAWVELTLPLTVPMPTISISGEASR